MAVVSCCDAPPILELAEHALDEVSSAICLVIERIGRTPCSGRWNDSLDLSPLQPIAQTVGIIGFVGQQPFGLGHHADQWNGHGDVGDVAWRQREGDRSAAIIGQSMDFARSSTTRAANRFRERPLFEPAAERCALTWLLSMESSSGTGPAAAIFSKTRCQMRRCDHLL
jgi:hypothetical protein